MKLPGQKAFCPLEQKTARQVTLERDILDYSSTQKGDRKQRGGTRTVGNSRLSFGAHSAVLQCRPLVLLMQAPMKEEADLKCTVLYHPGNCKTWVGCLLLILLAFNEYINSWFCNRCSEDHPQENLGLESVYSPFWYKTVAHDERISRFSRADFILFCLLIFTNSLSYMKWDIQIFHSSNFIDNLELLYSSEVKFKVRVLAFTLPFPTSTIFS